MEIRPVVLADDNEMRAAYDVEQAAVMLGREGMPHWTFEEFLGALRASDSGERQEYVAAFDDGRVLGTAAIWFPLHDNLDKTWFNLKVDPAVRGRGVGSALLAHVEKLAAADGRTTLLTDSKIPVGERETHPYRRFAEAHGYVLSNVEVVRHLDLPVPDEQLQAWVDEAAAAHAGYTVEVLVDGIPDDLAESLCVLLGQLAVDAPTGEADFEEEQFTPERLKERQETVHAMGRSLYEAVALTPDRIVAAQSTLSVPLGGGTDVFQWGTFVHREHRGHRLGLAVKAANIRAVQQAHPLVRRITTQNAETNDFMVSINVKMGFRPVEDSAEWIKRL